MKIKVCGLRERNNILQVAALMPEFMGFIFYDKSPRYAEGIDADLLNCLPKLINKVGVFVNEDPFHVTTIAETCGLSHLQLHGSETPEECRYYADRGFQVIKVFKVDEHFDPGITEAYTAHCHYFLFDTKTEKHGGSGKKFDWRLLDGRDFKRPVMIGGGIGPEDLQMINAINFPVYAVDVNSRFETAPGIKNIKKLEQFILQLT